MVEDTENDSDTTAQELSTTGGEGTHMTDSKAASKDKPNPADVKIKVINPRYEGATFEMVVKAMLQRPRKSDQKGDDEAPDEPESGGAQSSA